MAVTNNLRDIRFEMKLDQNDFALKLGVNPATYNRWEKNRQQPSLEWVMRIAKVTGKPVESFIMLDDHVENKID